MTLTPPILFPADNPQPVPITVDVRAGDATPDEQDRDIDVWVGVVRIAGVVVHETRHLSHRQALWKHVEREVREQAAVQFAHRLAALLGGPGDD